MADALRCRRTSDGLLVCGQAFGRSAEDQLPVGGLGFIQQFLQARLLQLEGQLGRLVELAPSFDHDQGIQLLIYMLRLAMPSRVLHLFRGCSWQHIHPWVEEVDSLFRRIVAQLLRLPSFTALQWSLACLPTADGGGGLPDLPSLAMAARATALVQLPILPQTQPAIAAAFDAEMVELQDRLTQAMHHPASALLRREPHHADPRSPAPLMRKLLEHIHTQNARSIAQQGADDELPWAYRCVPASQIALQNKASGAWLLCCPTNYKDTLPNQIYCWAWRDLLGLPDAELGPWCQRCLPTGQLCGADLDAHGRHLATCHHGLWVRRHNLIRGLVQELGRAAGCTAIIEQRLPFTQRHAATGERYTHTTDVQLVDSHGNQILIDVRSTARPIAQPMQLWLEHHEKLKRREYGLSTATLPSSIHDGVRPLVIEASGCMAPCACAIIDTLTKQSAGLRMLQWGAPWSVAIQAARNMFFIPLSVGLLKMRWHARMACMGYPEQAEPVEPADSRQSG